jgi:hypothetical protein
VIGVLHGWDRLRLQGTLRSLYYGSVIAEYLQQAGVLCKDFKKFATWLSSRYGKPGGIRSQANPICALSEIEAGYVKRINLEGFNSRARSSQD